MHTLAYMLGIYALHIYIRNIPNQAIRVDRLCLYCFFVHKINAGVM